MKKLLLILSLFILGPSLLAQPTREWDLSYQSILDFNEVKWNHSQGTIFTWLKDREQEHKSIVNFVNKEIEKDPSEAFLIDHPTFPSGGRITVLGVKYESGCFYFWRSTDEKMREFKRQPMSKELFNQIFSRLHTLKQRGFENMGGPEKAYAGFLSTMKSGQTKQLLLHINDFLEFDVEDQQILRAGRIFEIENSLQVNNN